MPSDPKPKGRSNERGRWVTTAAFVDSRRVFTGNRVSNLILYPPWPPSTIRCVTLKRKRQRRHALPWIMKHEVIRSNSARLSNRTELWSHKRAVSAGLPGLDHERLNKHGGANFLQYGVMKTHLLHRRALEKIEQGGFVASMWSSRVWAERGWGLSFSESVRNFLSCGALSAKKQKKQRPRPFRLQSSNSTMGSLQIKCFLCWSRSQNAEVPRIPFTHPKFHPWRHEVLPQKDGSLLPEWGRAL